MGFNFSNILNQFSNFQQFKSQLLASGKNPRKLLEAEIKKRGITPKQLKQLEQVARVLNKMGLK